jgi:multidrug resistance efflux pump
MNGNGNGNGKRTLIGEDRFCHVNFTKPRLFPSQSEIVRKTGILRNLVFFLTLMAAGIATTALPFSTSVVVRNAVVIPVQRTDLTSPTDGFVTQVAFSEGEEVKKGQFLLKVESLHDETFLREAGLEILALEKGISRETAEAELSALELEETKRLKKLGAIQGRILKEAILRRKIKHEKLGELSLRIERAKERVLHFQKILRQSEIQAPFNGRIISDIRLKEKSFVKAGEFLFTLASQDSLVEAPLKERDFSRISIGSEARIRFAAFPEKSYRGRVVGFKYFAEPLPQSGRSRHAVKVLIRCEDIPRDIPYGMSAKVKIQAKHESFLKQIYHELF